MKYFSYLDHFNLSITDIINVSPYTLKLVTNRLNSENIEEKASILSGLENSELRSYHIYIEQHIWLKELLLSNFSTLKKHKIECNTHNTLNKERFSVFLSPYLEPILPNLIHQLITANSIKLLFEILTQHALFTPDLKEQIKSILQQKLSYANSELRSITTSQSFKHITYIKHYYFYNILNLYQPHFKPQLLQLYDTIIEVKSKFSNDATDPIFRFVAQVQVAFKRSRINDVAAKLYIDNNADNAVHEAYDDSSKTIVKSGKSLLKIYALLALFATTLIASLFFIASLYKNYTPTETTDEPSETSSPKKMKRMTYDNRIRFYYTLKRLTLKTTTDSLSASETTIAPFSNPYPKTFNKITSESIASENAKVLIENKSYADLIVFKMVKGKDESLYIPKNEATYIALKPSDSLLFYHGDYFMTSEFSRFKNLDAISEIYNIKNIGSTQSSVITINATTPFFRKVITKKHIETSNDMEIQRISIDNLYRNYYDKYTN